jgi:hypothetical protein
MYNDDFVSDDGPRAVQSSVVGSPNSKRRMMMTYYTQSKTSSNSNNNNTDESVSLFCMCVIA